MSWNWFWPAGVGGLGPGGPGASTGSLMGGSSSWGLWLQGTGVPEAGVSLLIGGAGSQG